MSMCLVKFCLLVLAYANAEDCACNLLERPEPSAKELSARWMAHTLDWGVLSTKSTRLEDAPPFGNPYSFVDGPCDESTGTPYFYGSHMDQSFLDMAADNSASFALSEASMPFVCGGYNLDDCKVSSGDPENPMCARLVMTGKLVEIETNSDEYKKVQQWLFQRHPSMASWPADHGWVIAKLEIEDIWFIDYFGGAAIVDPADYHAAELDMSKMMQSVNSNKPKTDNHGGGHGGGNGVGGGFGPGDGSGKGVHGMHGGNSDKDKQESNLKGSTSTSSSSDDSNFGLIFGVILIFFLGILIAMNLKLMKERYSSVATVEVK